MRRWRWKCPMDTPDDLLNAFAEAGVTPDEVEFDGRGRMLIRITALRKLAALAQDPAEAARFVAELETNSEALRRMDTLANCEASGLVH